MGLNITNISAITSFPEMTRYANEATGGIFASIILIGILIILTINLRNNGIERAMVGALFGSFAISLFFLYLKWVNIIWPTILALALAGTLFYIRFQERGRL